MTGSQGEIFWLGIRCHDDQCEYEQEYSPISASHTIIHLLILPENCTYGAQGMETQAWSEE